MATILRGIQGVMSGQFVVLKALMGETLDERMLSYGLALLMSAMATGFTVGPSIRGWTAFPAEQHPASFSEDGIFGRFPALLTHIIIAVGLGLGILLTFVLFPKNMPNQRSEPVTEMKPIGYGATESEKNNIVERIVERDTESQETLFQRFKSSNFMRVLRSKECSLCSLLYMLTSVVEIGFEEMFPILAATSPAYKGLGFSPTDIGMVLMVYLIACIVLQITLLPRLNNYFGSKKYLILSSLVLVFVTPLFPMISAIHNITFKWGTLIVVLLVHKCCTLSLLLSINVLISNSVENGLLGSAYGVTYMAANLGSLIGPLMCGAVYSWSLRNIQGVEGNVDPLGFPLNQFCTFYLLSGLSVVVATIAATLDDRMDTRKLAGS